MSPTTSGAGKKRLDAGLVQFAGKGGSGEQGEKQGEGEQDLATQCHSGSRVARTRKPLRSSVRTLAVSAMGSGFAFGAAERQIWAPATHGFAALAASGRTATPQGKRPTLIERVARSLATSITVTSPLTPLVVKS